MIGHIGKVQTDPSLLVWLASESINLREELKLENGEFTAYVERPNAGFCLVFRDEAMFLGKGSQGIGEGPLYFSGTFFYSEGKDGYSQFEGPLPGAIQFDDTRSSVINKLGPPIWQRERGDGSIAAEKWSINGLSLHVTYRKAGGVVLVSVSRPDKRLRGS